MNKTMAKLVLVKARTKRTAMARLVQQPGMAGLSTAGVPSALCVAAVWAVRLKDECAQCLVRYGLGHPSWILPVPMCTAC
jgi:hypothetical protein